MPKLAQSSATTLARADSGRSWMWHGTRMLHKNYSPATWSPASAPARLRSTALTVSSDTRAGDAPTELWKKMTW